VTNNATTLQPYYGLCLGLPGPPYFTSVVCPLRRLRVSLRHSFYCGLI